MGGQLAPANKQCHGLFRADQFVLQAACERFGRRDGGQYIAQPGCKAKEIGRLCSFCGRNAEPHKLGVEILQPGE